MDRPLFINSYSYEITFSHLFKIISTIQLGSDSFSFRYINYFLSEQTY